MKTQSLNRYEKIMARSDKKRPMFVKEVITDDFLKRIPDGMVLKIKVLTPLGGTVEISWSEKDVNKMSKEKQ